MYMLHCQSQVEFMTLLIPVSSQSQAAGFSFGIVGLPQCHERHQHPREGLWQ